MNIKKYKFLKASDLIRYGDERWDYEFGWTVNKDRNMERFSREYRRVGTKAAHQRRFRRPLTQTKEKQQ